MSNPLTTTLALASVTLLLAACAEPSTPPAVTADRALYEEGLEQLLGAKTRFEYPNAVATLERAVAADPEHGPTRIALAYALLKQSKFDEAEVHLAAAEETEATLVPVDRLWLAGMRARVDDAIEREIAAWETLTEAVPDNRWAWYELAVARSMAGRWADSAVAAATALELEPDPAKWEASWIYYLHSKALYRSGQVEAAGPAGAAGRANATTWRSTFYRMAIGQVAAGEKDAESLVEEYWSISNAEGRNNESYTEANVALFYFELGDYPAAVEHARRALELNPDAYQYWTLVYALSESDAVDEAVEVAERAAAAFPDDPYVLAARGWALYRAGDLEPARAALLAARAASPRRHTRAEAGLAVVEAALADAQAEPAPPIPWLG